MSASGGDEGHPGRDPANFGHYRVFALLSAVAKSLIKNAALHSTDWCWKRRGLVKPGRKSASVLHVRALTRTNRL